MLRSPLDAWLAGKLGCDKEELSKEKLWMYQKARLAATLQWSLVHSPFYRSRLQGLAASHILDLRVLADSAAGGSAYQQILTALAGEQIHFKAEGWKVDEYLAVPVSQAVNAPLGLFVSLNNGPMLRLDLSKP